MGRPTKYKPEFENQAVILAEKGFTDKETAEIFGVTSTTIDNWKKLYPQFFASLKKGKEIADSKVVQSLYQRALGYSHPEVDIRVVAGKLVKTQIIKHYPPDPTSMIFWLKNRDTANWRDKVHEQVDTTLTIKHEYGKEPEQNDKKENETEQTKRG